MSGEAPSQGAAHRAETLPEITIDVGDVPLEHTLPPDLGPEETAQRVGDWVQEASVHQAAASGAILDQAQPQPAEATQGLHAALHDDAMLRGGGSEAGDRRAGSEPQAAPESRGDGGGGGDDWPGAARGAKAKKAVAALAAARRWLRIDSNGETVTIGASKYKIAQKLGVQPRDLRFLEMQTHGFSPPALLTRENAIVVSFESIRCIITLDYVLVINPDDERVAGLIEDFKTQLRNPGNLLNKKGYPGVSKLSDVASKLRYGRAVIELPFELKALEICFDKMVSELSSNATDLEREALPALEVLTKRIRQPDLEAVRRVKSRLVRLKTRIESIHQVLERFLNHDDDMHRLNLTAEELSRQASEEEHEKRNAAAAAAAARAAEKKARAAAAAAAAAAGGAAGASSSGRGVVGRVKTAAGVGGSAQGSRAASVGGASDDGAVAAKAASSHSSSSFDSQDEAEVAEVEMLLEAYDMHLEHALSRLQTLDEYIQDTEDLINTSLDQKRNELITIDILLTSHIVALGLMTTVSSIMGMNLVPYTIQLQEDTFNQVAIASTLGTYVLYGAFLLWAMKQNLLAF